MLGRLLLILALAWPAVASLRVGSAHESSCCPATLIEEATPAACRDDLPELHHCGQPADRCVCGVQEVPAPQAPPKAPLPRPDEPVAHRLPGTDGVPIRLRKDDGQIASRPVTVIVAALRTHNETQSILSVWRT